MPKYKFLEDCELKQGDGRGPIYKAGEVYTLSMDQGERWKRRLKAEDYVDPNPVPSKFEASLAKPVLREPALMATSISSPVPTKISEPPAVSSVKEYVRPTKPTEEDA